MLIRIFLALVVCVQVVFAQNSKKEIQVLAKPKKDGLWLRWAPMNPTVWQLGNKYGYLVERFVIKSDGELENPLGERISINPLKPHSAAELDKLSESVKEAGVLSELIYGTSTDAKPTNDLGAIIAHNEDLENKFGVALLVCDLSTEVARAAGLFITDNTVVKGKRYIYRVRLATQPKGKTIEPGVVVVDMTDEKPLVQIKDLQAEFRDRSVMLKWSTIFHQGIYSFYFIEKSLDGKMFERVSDLPYVHMADKPESEFAFYVDSLEANSQTYHFRILGMSPFGELGPPSNIVKGEGRDDLSGLLIVREAKVQPSIEMVDANKQSKGKVKKITSGKNEVTPVEVTWEFPVDFENQISGFVVSRSKSADGPYEDVVKTPLSNTQRSYTDQTPFNNTYYQLRAVDRLGNELSRSYPYLIQVEDNTPPTTPTNLQGAIDKNGVVSLVWPANPDADLMGYRVFRSNSLREEPAEITRAFLKKCNYTDTVNIRVLNRDVYYQIVAVDNNFNASEYSIPLKLKRPDVIAPAAPVFTRSEVKRDSILLEWNNSASDDVAVYELIRFEAGDTLTVFTKSQALMPRAHVDLSAEPGLEYQYKLIVRDSSGNSSDATTRKIFFEPGYRKSISDFRAEVNREDKSIELQWKNSMPPLSVIIFRCLEGGKQTILTKIEGDVQKFIDREVKINNLYKYRIQAVFQGGVRSVISKEILVRF